ncbi:hypothetical protein CVT24_010101 [Panaeolus cyanescens]|uniref:LysM domain-containing protein n=1 Tax=Panaeolus cyanescens TaxID=181874 RepID=A0A409W9H4_9AGAR|nr:hypothetical protein CVT24_010101 [Panaeolus cyanescens]
MFSRLFTIAVVAGSITSSWAAASSCTRTYTVKAGDYCDKISDAQKVPTFQLAAVNSPAINSGCTNLMPGQELCLGTPGEDCTDTYTVIADDTCEAIAAARGFNTTILHLNNPQLTEQCDNLYIGEAATPAPSSSAPAPSSSAPAAPASSSAPAPAATNAPAGGDDDDDDDLPFCDELEQ